MVNAEYYGCPEPVEEYIDLVPILNSLYFDVDELLAPIEGVAVA